MQSEEAKGLLDQQITASRALDGQMRFSPEFNVWIRDTEVVIEKIFGVRGRHLLDFRRVSYSSSVFTVGVPQDRDVAIAKFYEGLEHARALLNSMKTEIERFGLKRFEATSSSLPLVETICIRFHLVAKQLRERREGRDTLAIGDEYDAQDLMHALLRLYFDDIRPEEWTPSYAGRSARQDFLLKQEQMVLEIKKTRKGLETKEVGEQLIIDIAKYRNHADCKTLVCFVYDPEERIRNPRGLENDLTRDETGFDVRVIVSPKRA